MAVEVRDLSMELLRYPKGSRFLLAPDITLNQGVALNMDTTLVGPLRFDNRVLAMGNDHQVHTIGWEFRTYVRLWDRVEVGFGHHSQHRLDDNHPFMKFPAENAFVLKFIFAP